MQQVSETWETLTSANGRDMMAAIEEAELIKARVLCGDLKQSDTAAAVKSCIASMGGKMQLFTRAMQAPPPPRSLEKAANEFGSDIMGAMGSSGSGLFGSLAGFGLGGQASGGRNTPATKKTMSEAVSAAVEHFKDRKRTREMRGWLGEVSPELMEVMLERRDKHMFRELAGLAGAVGQVKGAGLRAVAVVGLAHMDGIEGHWAREFGASSIQSI
mmetsp:Transcript_53549/g.107541  ORF Transcript_53549/g.107541 Transcript_53549/m.107541 type:complete len:215 (+) Transcript_53549:352-996(+)